MMRHAIRKVLLAAIGGICLFFHEGRAAQGPKGPKAEKKLNVAVVTGGHGFNKAEFVKLFEGHRDIEHVAKPQKDHSELFEDITDWPFDVIVLFNMTQRISKTRQQNFLKLLDRGVGLVVLHHAIANFQGWPEYEKMIGAKYHLKPTVIQGVKHPGSGYKHGVDMRIHVEDPNHPITKGLSDFTIHDETYCRQSFAGDNHLLLTTDHPTSDKPIAWVRTHRKARVCTIQLGHGPPTYNDKNCRRIVAQAIRWTARRLSEGGAAAGFRPLFTGRDLSGWKADEEARKHWIVEDGILKFDGKGPTLWTQEAFGDFILKVDWRLPKPGDSGVFLRGSSKAQVNIWCRDMGSGEVWGYRTDGKMPEEVRKACTPSRKADKPVGQWNTFVITMKADRLTVVLNGQEVISQAALPGVPKTGSIALQRHGDPIEFRNILIKSLSG